MIGGVSVTDEFTNFESFTFTDGTFDLTTVFNQAPDAVDDTLSTLVQYDFSGTVSAKDEGVPWSSTYTFTLMVDPSTRVATSFGYEIPLVASATLNLPYFSQDAIDITTPIRLGYNTATNRVFFAATGTGHEDAYTITLTEPQEGIFLNQATFGPLTGTAAQFNFIGLRDIIGNALPPRIVFTGGTVTAEVAATGGVKTEDTPFTIAVSSLIGNDSDPDGDPITFVSVQGAVGGSVSLSGGIYHLHAGSELFRRGELHLHDPGFCRPDRHRDGLVQHQQCQRRAGARSRQHDARPQLGHHRHRWWFGGPGHKRRMCRSPTSTTPTCRVRAFPS